MANSPIKRTQTTFKPTPKTNGTDDGYIRITHVTPFHPRGNFVQWEIVDPYKMPARPWEFVIDRSENPTGPWTAISNGSVINVTALFDSLPTHHIMRYWYYRVRLVGGDECKFISKPQANLTALDSLDARMRGEVLSMRNDLKVLLEADSGVPISIFKGMSRGSLCTSCRSNVLNLVLNPSCNVCYGTGFIDGFYAPIHTRAIFNDPPTQEGVDIEGETELRQFQLQMLDFPLMAIDDLVFEMGTGQLYEVKNLFTTRRNRVIVHQEPNVSELERSSPFYKLVNNILASRLGNETFIFNEDFKRY